MSGKGFALSQNAISQLAGTVQTVRRMAGSGRRRDGLPPLLPGGSSSPDSPLVQATVGSGGSVSAGFPITLYGKGWDKASTGAAIGWPADLAYGETLEDGEQIIAFAFTATVTGDEE